MRNRTGKAILASGIIVIIAAVFLRIVVVLVGGITGSAFVGSLFSWTGADEPEAPLTPDFVVRATLDALHQNDLPYHNAGIETFYLTVSPTQKATIGPLPQFMDLLSRPAYTNLINHEEAALGTLVVKGNQAQQPVLVVTDDNNLEGFLFILSRQQDGPFKDAWMTESVIPMNILNYTFPGSRPGSLF